MRIGIDISQVVYEGTGVSRFTKGLVNAILRYDTENEWFFFFSSLRRNLDTQLKKQIKEKGYRLFEWKIPPTLLSFLSNGIHNPYLSSIIYPPSSNLDWFITSDWTEPSLPHVKKATIIHDLVYLRYLETVDEKIRKTQEKRLQWVKKESKLIFADSDSTKKDLIDFLSIDGNRAVVNYPGVEVKKPATSYINQTLKKYKLESKKYILTVGKLEPRKNLNRLIDALKQVKNESLQLIIVGPKGWQSFDSVQNKQLNNIQFLGLIPDEELYSLYSSCLFFIFPSIWEGFGYPVLEAMQLGIPVACSNTSSLLEIAKDSALFFNPLDTKEMYQSIDRLIRDQNLRNKLIKKGLERSKIFTWKNYYNTFVLSLRGA